MKSKTNRNAADATGEGYRRRLTAVLVNEEVLEANALQTILLGPRKGRKTELDTAFVLALISAARHSLMLYKSETGDRLPSSHDFFNWVEEKQLHQITPPESSKVPLP